jgi:DNA-directed RNA polymerase specialized sigma24 family protein
MSRISHAMHQAIEATKAGQSVQEAAATFGVSVNGIYRALSRDRPRCSECKHVLRRNAAGIKSDSTTIKE